jgi:hypothetical protein
MGTLNILLHHFSFSYSLIAHHYQSWDFFCLVSSLFPLPIEVLNFN